jgi:hypothetical protein
MSEIESGFLEQVARDASQAKAIPRDEQLGVLAQKAEKQVELEDEIAQIEQQLKTLKEECAKIGELEIPELMHELGVEDFTLKNGLKVKVSAFYGAKIPEELADEAFDWLEEGGHESIIKGEFIVMYKRPDKQRLGQFYELARNMGFEVKDKLNVHPMTLKAFVKEMITEGHDLPRNLFGVYTGWRTKITKR